MLQHTSFYHDIENRAAIALTKESNGYIMVSLIGHVNEYPTMFYFRIPTHTQSMIAYKILTEFSEYSSEKLHCGNVVNKPYRIVNVMTSFFITKSHSGTHMLCLEKLPKPSPKQCCF